MILDALIVFISLFSEFFLLLHFLNLLLSVETTFLFYFCLQWLKLNHIAKAQAVFVRL